VTRLGANRQIQLLVPHCTLSSVDCLTQDLDDGLCVAFVRCKDFHRTRGIGDKQLRLVAQTPMKKRPSSSRHRASSKLRDPTMEEKKEEKRVSGGEKKSGLESKTIEFYVSRK
jgi:hypothetical protein